MNRNALCGLRRRGTRFRDFKRDGSQKQKPSLWALTLFIFSAAGLFAQGMDFGVGVNFVPGPGSTEVKKSTGVPKSAFVEHIAARTNVNADKMQKLWRRGYGFVELIKLSIITNESGQPFDTIVELREKKEKLSSIAKKYGLDYKKVYKLAEEIKDELVSEVTDFIFYESTGTDKEKSAQEAPKEK